MCVGSGAGEKGQFSQFSTKDHGFYRFYLEPIAERSVGYGPTQLPWEGGEDLAGHKGRELLNGHGPGLSDKVFAGRRAHLRRLLLHFVLIRCIFVVCVVQGWSPRLRHPLLVLVQHTDAPVLSDSVGDLQRVHPQGQFTWEDLVQELGR